MEKQIIFSGIQPSGDLTIGNYIGALKNWKEVQEEYDCYFCVVDMHAITVPQDVSKLRKKILETLALYIAVGINPEKSTMFIQSHVPAHAELAWVLNSITYLGQLNRMHQFKEKSKKSDENLNAALYTYPILMASDILLYKTNVVPVGEDQKQHLELARDLAIRFNNRFGEVFVVPEPMIKTVGKRIMSLQEPTKKMSKSDSDVNASIFILDSRDDIKRKIKRAVTDSIAQVNYSPEQPGVSNLIEIYSAFSGKQIEEIVEMYKGEGYGKFKEDLIEVIDSELAPLRERYKIILADKKYLEEVYTKASEKANYFAQRSLNKVYKKIGFILK